MHYGKNGTGQKGLRNAFMIIINETEFNDLEAFNRLISKGREHLLPNEALLPLTVAQIVVLWNIEDEEEETAPTQLVAEWKRVVRNRIIPLNF